MLPLPGFPALSAQCFWEHPCRSESGPAQGRLPHGSRSPGKAGRGAPDPGAAFWSARNIVPGSQGKTVGIGLTWYPATGRGRCRVPLAKQKRGSAGRRPPELSVWSWHPKSGARLPQRRSVAGGRRVPLPAPRQRCHPGGWKLPSTRLRSEGTAGFRGGRRRPGARRPAGEQPCARGRARDASRGGRAPGGGCEPGGRRGAQ